MRAQKFGANLTLYFRPTKIFFSKSELCYKKNDEITNPFSESMISSYIIRMGSRNPGGRQRELLRAWEEAVRRLNSRKRWLLHQPLYQRCRQEGG